MAEEIAAFFSGLPEELIVFLISVLPIVELRGAIPVGALVFNLPFYTNYILSVIGNLLPIPFILLFIPKILDFLWRFKFFRPMVEWLRKKADKHSTKVLGEIDPNESKSGVRGDKKEPRKMSKSIFAALLIFVAIPLPGTGAWTGSLVASLFYLPRWQSFLTITLGVLVSGVIMSLASYGVLGFLNFLL